jgi:hypothetical protein
MMLAGMMLASNLLTVRVDSELLLVAIVAEELDLIETTLSVVLALDS